MRVLRVVAVIAFVAACGGGSKPATTPKPEPTPDPIPVTAGPDCAAVASHLVTVLLADKPDVHAKALPVIRQHCNDDKWPDDVRSCMATASNDDESDACAKKLTDAQRDALEADAKRVMALDDGDGAVGAAPPTPASAAKPEAAPVPEKKSKGTTRGATRKGPKESDPCQGGQ
jgi:hypothetical protein